MPVNSRHPLSQASIQDWEDCRTFYMGEKAVKSAGTRYLPKPEETTKKEYQNYITRAGFFPAMNRTVSGLSGSIDRKAPTVDIPLRIEYLNDNADSNSGSLRQFSKTVLDEIFITGRCGILVERNALGGKPYLVCYDAESIINWAEDENQKLTLIVLLEQVYETSPSDIFEQRKIRQYRVLQLIDGKYVQFIYRDEEKSGRIGIGSALSSNGEPVTPLKAGVPLEHIPFVFCNTRSNTPNVEKPPLLDLVLKNAEHYRVSADYANALYYTGNPLLFIRGAKKAVSPKIPGRNGEIDPNEPNVKIAIGSSRAILLPKDADIGLVECKGHGVNPNRERTEDIKKEMAVLGARLLESQRASVETAETALIRQSGETSTLSDIVVNVSSAIKKALTYADEWQGGDGEGIEFTLNSDFVDLSMNPQMVSVLSDLVSKEYISWETFYYNLVIGEVTMPGRSHEEEREAIEGQPPMSVPTVSSFGQVQVEEEENRFPDDAVFSPVK